LNVRDLDRYIKYLEDVYFQFDESMEDFEFIMCKLKKFSCSDRLDETPMPADEDSKKTGMDFTLKHPPVICQSSPQSSSYSLLQISLCYLSWSSPHLMKQVRILSGSFISMETIVMEFDSFLCRWVKSIRNRCAKTKLSQPIMRTCLKRSTWKTGNDTSMITGTNYIIYKRIGTIVDSI
jgi:hypothetical protein